jgi:drug/metabolite transporter (DMT)-like permease
MSRRSQTLALPATNDAIAAILWMMGAAFFFSGLSATIRHLSGELHPLEIAFFRNLFGLVFMLPWLARTGFGGLRTGRLRLYLWRCGIGLMSMFTWFWALALLPFAQAIALSFTTPLFATAGAALILRERVRARRWTATLIGFLGVLVILRPGAEGLSLGAALVIASCVFAGATTLMVKDLLKTESTNAVVTYMVLLMTPFSLLPALFVWTWPRPETWLFLVGMGLVATLGHVCVTHAYKLTDASAVQPYDYTRMIFAAGIGYLWFAEVPDRWTWIGAGIIAAAAVYIAHRETLVGRSQATQAAASRAATDPALVPAARARPEGPVA